MERALADPSFPGAERAIDLVHLACQTHGDRALEMELLALFARQAEKIAARLAQPALPGEAQARADLAHTLRGSALAVGAPGVAEAAGRCEQAMGEGQIAALRRAVAAARAEVAHLLAA